MKTYTFDETGERFHLITVPIQPIGNQPLGIAEIDRKFNRFANLFCGIIVLIFFLLLSILACPVIINDELELSPCALGITVSVGVLGGISVIGYTFLVCRRWLQISRLKRLDHPIRI